VTSAAPPPVKSYAPICRNRPLSVSASGSVTPPRPVMARPHVHARAEQALRAASARRQPSRDACARRRRPHSGANILSTRTAHLLTVCSQRDAHRTRRLAVSRSRCLATFGSTGAAQYVYVWLRGSCAAAGAYLSKCNTQCTAACNMTAQNMYGGQILSAMHSARCATTAASLRSIATCSACVACLGVSVPEADRLVLGVNSECGGSSPRELE
jgi:hypothetical protein